MSEFEAASESAVEVAEVVEPTEPVAEAAAVPTADGSGTERYPEPDDWTQTVGAGLTDDTTPVVAVEPAEPAEPTIEPVESVAPAAEPAAAIAMSLEAALEDIEAIVAAIQPLAGQPRKLDPPARTSFY
jgi:hypothetical protein